MANSSTEALCEIFPHKIMIILSVRAFKFNTCSSLCSSFMCRLIINEGNNILSGSTLQAMVIASKGIHRRENHNVWFGIEEIPLQVSMVKTSPGIWSESFRRNLLDFTQLVAPYLDHSNPSTPPPLRLHDVRSATFFSRDKRRILVAPVLLALKTAFTYHLF